MELLDVLRKIELFNGVSDEDLARIVEICEQRYYTRGEIVMRQDEIADEIYIITKGSVEILVTDRKEVPILRVVANLGVGQIIGEMGLVDRGPRSATVRILEDQTCLQVLAYDALRTLFAENTGIGYTVMSNLAADISFKLRHANASTG